MAETKKDDVGKTVDGLGEGTSPEASSNKDARGKKAANQAADNSDAATAESKGTIGNAESGASLTQASGGSVD